MRVDKVSYAGNPEQVTREPFDCIWVRLSERKAAVPLAAKVLQWVDWRMLGQLSRHILAGRGVRSKTAFFPTMRKITSPLVAVAPAGAGEWDSFRAVCEGIKAKRVLVLCESSDDVAAAEKELRRATQELERIVLGSDGPVGQE